MGNLDEDIKKLQSAYKESNKKDEMYRELLSRYEKARERIELLEKKLEEKSNKMPTKEEVDAMSGMLDLINKLDESTIDKLNKFGDKKQ